METDRPLNLMDVDVLVKQFIEAREQSLATLHRFHFKNSNQLSLRAMKESLFDELRTGCVTFLNKGSPIEELSPYLFYIANAYCKKTAKPAVKQKTEYICPGCLFLGKEPSILSFSKIFKCEECQFELSAAIDPKQQHFFKTFVQHHKSGYHCQDCQRFVPHPLDNAAIISCPYFDCLFAGAISGLNKMHHPASKSNPEKLILDITQEGGRCLKDSLVGEEIDTLSQLEATEDLQERVSLLQEIMETQSNNVAYSSSNATVRHKQYVYQAFGNLLKEFPSEMSAYLISSGGGGYMGFQHKVFQEYIRLLEEAMPFVISQNKKPHKVDSLLDNTLCLFDGISVFNAVVSAKLSIKNETQEFYIGGRKASYAKPYYIGKLLNIIHKDAKTPLMHLVKDYSFSKIWMADIDPGTPVTVTHLRAPPHYQMGGMVYVNRVRKKIVERAKMVVKQCRV